MWRPALLSLLFALSSCGADDDDDGAPDAGAADASTVIDARPLDASALTDASVVVDAGSTTITSILGTLEGPCGVLAAELGRAQPSLFESRHDFVAGEAYLRAALSVDGQRVFDTPNAGGSSLESEVLSFEHLHHCEGASLLKTETEVLYDAAPDDAGPNSITDLLISINGMKVGLQITRAFRPMAQGMSDADVRMLLLDKLIGIRRSTQRVRASDRWVKQILHVYVATEVERQRVLTQLASFDAQTRGDSIVLITRTRGGGFIYCNPDPALGTECPLVP